MHSAIIGEYTFDTFANLYLITEHKIKFTGIDNVITFCIITLRRRLKRTNLK